MSGQHNQHYIYIYIYACACSLCNYPRHHSSSHQSTRKQPVWGKNKWDPLKLDVHDVCLYQTTHLDDVCLCACQSASSQSEAQVWIHPSRVGCVHACVWVFEHNSMRPTMSKGSKLQESLLHEKTTVLGGMDGDVYSPACFCHPGNVNLKLVW